MPQEREFTRELKIRIHSAEDVIHTWMTNNNISETTPELCMNVLVKSNVYKYDSKGRVTISGNNLLEIAFTKIVVKQIAPGAPWYINIK